MFQTFNVTARPEQGPPRLQALRTLMAAQGVDGFLIPRADAHQGEYVAPRDERLAWLTGFTGSAGFCAALMDVAGVFIDGRYRTQVKHQVAPDFTPVPWPEVSLAQWLRDAMPGGGVVAFDPWLHPAGQITALAKEVADAGISLRSVENFVDLIWADQPAPPNAPAAIHDLEFAGETHSSKRTRLAQDLVNAGQSSAVITLPDSLCWLLNIRGSDVAHNPVMHGLAILHANGDVDLFADRAKLQDVLAHLGSSVSAHDPDTFPDALDALAGPVLIDPLTVPFAVSERLGPRAVTGSDPCALPKARKNFAEVSGAAAAHIRDAAAVVETLAWLDDQPAGSITEIDVVTALEGNRRADPALRDISFETISGTGPNGAIMHYRVTHDTNAPLMEGQLLVLDSGGQYLDGTTDITRTIAIGTPDSDAKSAYTRVLSGMIAMSRLRWPRGLAGRDIEAIGRMPLWLAGQDFDHGLGHGVGAYLSVHEGPQRLSKVSSVPIEAGMILSNEPGYYREGAFGIRIENLLVAQTADAIEGGDAHREMLVWQTLTYVPFDRRLIDTALLAPAERAWIDAYHAQVAQKIEARLSPKAKTWLDAATAPL